MKRTRSTFVTPIRIAAALAAMVFYAGSSLPALRPAALPAPSEAPSSTRRPEPPSPARTSRFMPNPERTTALPIRTAHLRFSICRPTRTRCRSWRRGTSAITSPA